LPVKDSAEAYEKAQEASRNGYDAYFAIAELRNPENRTADNAFDTCGLIMGQACTAVWFRQQSRPWRRREV
jgi:hypothetical protein